MVSHVKSITTAGIMLALLISAGGCVGRIVKESVGAARGARGSHFTIMPLAGGSSATAAYDNFELGNIQDEYGKTPSSFFSYLRTSFASQLVEDKLPSNPAGKTLLIRGTVVHFELSGGFGHAFGPLEEVIARIELVDKATGQVLGTSNCVGRTKESNTSGIEKKAQGLSKAIIGWIKTGRPADE